MKIGSGGQQPPSTLKELILWGEDQFRQAGLFFGHGTDNALDEAAAIVLKSAGLPYEVEDEVLDRQLSEDEKTRIVNKLSERITLRKPAAYLTGEMFFAGLSFFVDERVLVPRSPIAELILEQFAPWVDTEKVRNILDLCTGSGCIAIACSATFPQAKIDAVDLSEDALEVCRLNIERHQKQSQVEAVHSDLFNQLVGRKYDIIVSNPPYVSRAEWESLPEEFHHEPAMGFKGGESGLDLVDRILAKASKFLNPGGILVVEVGSSAETLIAAYPNVPFIWLEFEFGGDGVFLLTAEDLESCRPYLKNNN